MLEVVSLSHQVSRRGRSPLQALDAVHFKAPRGHLLAILGAKGSGKSTLLKLLGSQSRVQAGAIIWNGRDIAQQPLQPNEVGIVSTDESALQPLMSVKEHLVSALMLALGEAEKREHLVRADRIMALCGLETVSGQRVESIDTPSRRRLALGIALAADPAFLLCDGFTEDVDPKSERELGALLQTVAKSNPWRVVVCATQSLSNLSLYDTVLVLHEGCVCFHGPGRAITHYFSIPHTEDLYQRLAMRPVQRWQDSWSRHSDSYYAAFKLAKGSASSEDSLGSASDEDDGDKTRLRLGAQKSEAKDESQDEAPLPEPPALASLGKQISMVIRRRFTVFRRARKEWWTQLAMIVGGPLLALLLSWTELPALRSLRGIHVMASTETATHLGAFALGFLMFQVLLLIGMAVKTSARELANERSMWIREQRAGLSRIAYMMGKAMFIIPLVLAQGVAMSIVVDVLTGGLPGNAPSRALLLITTGLAFSALVLAISAWSQSADRAEARSWMLAFLQLPLAGALAAWPKAFGAVLHPFVTAFYGWSGCVDTLHGTLLFEPLTKMNSTWFATPSAALVMLLIHLLVGVSLVVIRLGKGRQ